MVKYDYLFVYTGTGATARTLIKRDFFDREYVNANISRKEFRAKYAGISDKTINQTYKFLYTPEEVKVIHNRKVATRQRSNNSNKVNWGVPRVLLDKTVLEGYIAQGKTKEAISLILQVAPQTVEANLNYHQVVKPKHYGYEKFMPPSDILDFEHLETLLGVDILSELKVAPTQRNPETILPKLAVFEGALHRYKGLISTYKRRLYDQTPSTRKTLQAHRSAGSKLNAIVGGVFQENGYEITYEFEVNKKYFDIHIVGHNLLIEVDPKETHSSFSAIQNDSLKDALAKQEGYKLFRLVVSSKQRPEAIKQKTKECLQKLILDGLLH